ncbi:7 alpha-cephem-methoxylase [Penicillium herquei]|nr:7 alpha-cephem-methoxylase [Penicillium herquei]
MADKDTNAVPIEAFNQSVEDRIQPWKAFMKDVGDESSNKDEKDLVTVMVDEKGPDENCQYCDGKGSTLNVQALPLPFDPYNMKTESLEYKQNEVVRLNYFQWKDDYQKEKPYEILSAVPSGCLKQNFVTREGPHETIHDIRGRESSFNLDDNGFTIFKSKIPEFQFDENHIRQKYLPDVKSILQSIDPGAEVCFFDWKLRSSKPDRRDWQVGAKIDLNDPMICLAPVLAVHNDQSVNGALNRLRQCKGEEAMEVLKNRRWRIINVWRPLSNSIVDYPLAVCDGSTVPADKLVAVDHIRKHHIGESFYPLQCEGYRWYYLSRQAPNEVLLFKTYDSSTNVKAKFLLSNLSFRPLLLREKQSKSEH